MRSKIWLFLSLFVFFSQGALAEPYRPLDHLWYGTRDIPSSGNLVVLGVGTALTLGALSVDDSIKNFFAGQNRLGGWESVGNFWGSGISSAVLGLGFVGYGLTATRPYELEAGEAHLEALVANMTYTVILKLSFQRGRPDSSDPLAFPSGHTSNAFATAGNFMGMYGPTWGVPALGLGVLTAASRLSSNRHWLSDVIFGATLGYIVGYAYTNHHREDQKETAFFIYPFFENRSEFGVVARVGF